GTGSSGGGGGNSGDTTFVAPVGENSVFKKLADGSFQRQLADGTLFSYDGHSLKLTRVEDRYGNSTDYKYDQNDHLTEIDDAVGLKTMFSYSGNRVSHITDPANRMT